MTTAETAPAQAEHAPEIPSKNLPPVPYKDPPDAPPLRKVLGPNVILVGVGIATGEYILWPYISSQVGLVFMWAVPIGVLMQYSSTWRSSATRSPPERPPWPASSACGSRWGS